NLIHRNGRGINFLALIFGTLLSSQGTDASFVLTLSGFPPGFRSVLFLRFRLYQSLSRLFSALQVIRFRVFPFRRVRLYQSFSFSLTTLRLAE
ncbi:hypothetical protein ACFYYB_23490, partial [Streptomyces sp. NPDC002886]|uniref:hypothetical protein n=1 Tax=Streptomyces sp. NPDC002886 TaxID=3364667 RepID=UPI0036A67625